MSTPKSKIYTKTGDQGKTRLVGGGCVDKFNPRVEAYGTVDELNSYLGVIRAGLAKNYSAMDADLKIIQNEIFNVGSQLACEDAAVSLKLPPVSSDIVTLLETRIDVMDAEMPKLNQFILPAGDLSATQLHFARTLCRRSERRTAELHNEDPRFQNPMIFLNRLSDYLFMAARWINFKNGFGDVPWVKNT